MIRWVGAALVFIALIIGSWFYYLQDSTGNLAEDAQDEPRCLKDTERVVYGVLENDRPGRVRVSVVDTVASSTVWARELIHPAPNNAHSFQSRKCWFYLQQAFNYDYESRQMLPNYSFELWRFKYFTDEGNSLLVIDGVDKQSTKYNSVFNVDVSEKYTTLIKSYLGKPDYALVVKNIETGVDEFVLTLDDVLKDHPDAAGSFDVGAWVTRPDGTYLSTILYDGSRWMAYIYVKAGTWETEIYETPSDYMAGVERSAPTFAPLLAYTDVIVWAGFDTVTEALLQEQIASEQKKHLIVANLKTGGKTVLEEVPIVRDHRFNLKWLSDTELHYTMPDGSVRTYIVRN